MNESKITVLIIAANVLSLNRIRMILDDYHFDNHGTLDLEPWQDRLDPSKPPAVLVLFGLGGTRLQATITKGIKSFKRLGLEPPAIVCITDETSSGPVMAQYDRVEFLPPSTLNTPDELEKAIRQAADRRIKPMSAASESEQ